MDASIEEMRSDAGKRLVLLRLALGFKTTSSFAEECCIKLDALSTYENGLRAIPWPLLRFLWKRYKISSDWILHGDESAMPAGVLKKAKEIAAMPDWDKPVRGPKSKGRHLSP